MGKYKKSKDKSPKDAKQTPPSLLASKYKYQCVHINGQVLKVTPYNSCADTSPDNFLAYLGENNFGANSTFKSGVKFYTDSTPGFVVQKIERIITDKDSLVYYELFYISCPGVVSPEKCESFEADDFVLGEDITHSTPEGTYKQTGTATFYPFAAKNPPITKEMMDGTRQYESLSDNIKTFLDQFEFGNVYTPAAGLPYMEREPDSPRGIKSNGEIIRVIEFDYGKEGIKTFEETFTYKFPRGEEHTFAIIRFDCDDTQECVVDEVLGSLNLKTNCSFSQKINKICKRVTKYFSEVTAPLRTIKKSPGGGGKKTRTKKRKKKKKRKNKSRKRRKKKKILV